MVLRLLTVGYLVILDLLLRSDETVVKKIETEKNLDNNYLQVYGYTRAMCKSIVFIFYIMTTKSLISFWVAFNFLVTN